MSTSRLRLWEEEKKKTHNNLRLHVSSYHLAHRCFSMTMKTNPAYTHFCFFLRLCMWEKASLCPHSIKAWSLSLLNMLIHLVPPTLLLFLSAHETPTAPLSLSQVGERGSGLLQWRLGGPGLHPPWFDDVWWREEVQHVILLTIPVTYGERTGLSSRTVAGVAGPACLSNQGTFSLKLLMWDHWCRKDEDCFARCHRDGSLQPSDRGLVRKTWTTGWRATLSVIGAGHTW